MKDKTNISLAISIAAIFISLYSLNAKNEEPLFRKSESKTYVSGDPSAKNKLNKLEKNMMESPLTPQLNTSQKKLPKTQMKFKNDKHEFGNVEVNSENKYSFAFTNSGTEPLKISNAKGSCGCTVPKDWSREPLNPGESSQFSVKFDGKGRNNTSKTVTITANTQIGRETVKITAFVNNPEMDQKLKNKPPGPIIQ